MNPTAVGDLSAVQAEEVGHELDASRSGDGGFSLIEMIVAVSLMGIAAVSILGGLWSATRVSRIGNDKAKVEAVLSSATDRLTGWAYLPCPAADANGGYLPVVQAASATVGWPSSTVAILDITYWSPTGDATGSWSATNGLAGADCNPAVGLTNARTLQKVTIRVTSPDGRTSRQLEVVKNDVFPGTRDI
jgi:prepilin-type N-terminal cleavage/methylation domain-containing protein